MLLLLGRVASLESLALAPLDSLIPVCQEATAKPSLPLSVSLGHPWQTLPALRASPKPWVTDESLAGLEALSMLSSK